LFSFILGIILFAFNSPVSTINQYNTNETQIISNQNTDQIISDAIYQYEECGKDSENEKTFISYALL
jgi:hypothetical protein